MNKANILFIGLTVAMYCSFGGVLKAAKAGEVEVKNSNLTAQNPATPNAKPAGDQTIPKPKSAFFEQERRTNDGFTDFLTDAVDGVSDPIAGTGGVGTGFDGPRIEAGVRNSPGLSPLGVSSFDRTSVVIPRR
ncbi:hypothetical protein QUB08_25765 [Microcoleus sp. BR0-C5]|uniref:hypothetical protein n=1 Tax=Microcoleus sp. BR0-C5 TaxID=2818713 RepID=UPI002FD35101